MQYLIDGHNLIGKMPDIDLHDPNDEVKLVLRLRSWAAAGRKRRVTVIFDGGLPGGKEKRLSSGGVKVIFAPPGKTADALLIGRIRRIKNPKEFRVITSDQHIIAAAAARGVPHWRSETFVARMAQERRANEPDVDGDDSPGTAVDPTISPSEVAEFLELFGPEPERPLPPERQAKLPKKPAATPPKKKTERDSLDDVKRGDDRLEQDEIEEWLRLFGNGRHRG